MFRYLSGLLSGLQSGVFRPLVKDSSRSGHCHSASLATLFCFLSAPSTGAGLPSTEVGLPSTEAGLPSTEAGLPAVCCVTSHARGQRFV